MDCPACKEAMITLELEEVEIDYCPDCGGIWLDAGELGVLRSLFGTEQERHTAAEEYFAEIFGNELTAMKAENQVELGKTRRIAKAFRFICPTKYIPGKQDWGAF